ncbi:Arc family DNA-binding protein [Pseudomonas otitidis]|nr:Arc family DNA-binding protein [Pseudomonas otitidis]
MPAALKEELEALARVNRRSLTAEIVARLERSVSEPDEMGFSDRYRIENPEEFPPLTFEINKKALTDGLSPVSHKESVFLASMLKALREIVEMPDANPEPQKKKGKRAKAADNE